MGERRRRDAPALSCCQRGLLGCSHDLLEPLCDTHLTHLALDILRSRRTTRIDLWKKRKRRGKGAKRTERASLHFKSAQSGMSDILPRLCDTLSTIHSIQDALKTFFQPIENDGARPGFYAVYRGGGGRVRHRLFQEVRRGPQYHPDFCESCVARSVSSVALALECTETTPWEPFLCAFGRPFQLDHQFR